MKMKIDSFKELDNIPSILGQVLEALKDNATYVASVVKNWMTNYEEVFFCLLKSFFDSGYQVKDRPSAAK